jgi:RNA polymerase sigma factor (sigma-70 family)|tara:strand:+ start:256 stop:1002 length:747 start_codon:yes stop_codon:yes gene_type:complete
MKNYDNYNYSRYKADLKASMPEGKSWDEYTRDELIVKFMPLVENLARKFSTADSATGVMSITDLMSMGHIGLIQAVDKIQWQTIFESDNPERRLKSFLAKRIKGSIRRRVDTNRGSMRIPEHKLNELRKADPENKEASALYFNSVFSSIDEPDKQGYMLEIPEEENQKNNADLNKVLIELCEKYLTSKEFDVVRMSYGLNCEKHSASKIAEHLNIKGSSSYVRVSQLKKQAIDKLKVKADRSQVTDYL